MQCYFLGHASLVVKTADCTILFDPLLGQTLGNNCNEIYPSRRIDPTRLGHIDILVVSHRHNDHLDVQSLSSVRQHTDVKHVIVPDDNSVLSVMRALGFTSIKTLHPYDTFLYGGTTIMGTPSRIPVPELGFIISDASGTIWNMVDSDCLPFVGDVLARHTGSVDAVLLPYQSGYFNEFIPLLGVVMHPDTVRSLQRQARIRLEQQINALTKISPAAVMTFSNGLCYPAVLEEMNGLHFVAQDSDAVAEIGRRMPTVLAETSSPGKCLTLQPKRVAIEMHLHPCLLDISPDTGRLRFRPESRLPDILTPLTEELMPDSERSLATCLEQIEQCRQAWIASGDARFINCGRRLAALSGSARWLLSVVTANGIRQLCLDWDKTNELCEAGCSLPELRLHEKDLIGICENRVALFDVILGARVRMALPESVAPTNALLTELVVDPAWFFLAHVPTAFGVQERSLGTVT